MRGRPGCLALLFFGLVLFLPLFLANAMLTALARLGLSPETSLLAALGIFLGGTLNVPVKRFPREEVVEVQGARLFGLRPAFPQLVRRRTEMTIAVNVGGCVIPVLIAVYELYRLALAGGAVLALTGVAVAVNVAVCRAVAKPVPGMGIAMPGLVPGPVAALTALLLVPDLAPPVAFTAGVLGPLVGADLLHLDEVKELGAGTASIGGAGTFDGIVLSGLLATLLA